MTAPWTGEQHPPLGCLSLLGAPLFRIACAGALSADFIRFCFSFMFCDRFITWRTALVNAARRCKSRRAY